MIAAILFVLPYFTIPTHGFAVAPFQVCSKNNSLICAAVKPSFVPEYRVEEEDGQDKTIAEVSSVENDAPAKQPASKSNAESCNVKPMFAAMEPGTVVQIQVGDVSLARKAWKKRRRSGSPLLVPCSVLKVDRQSTVRWNLIYLLEKFGSKHAAGTRISLIELTRRHRKHLQSSLTHQATVMGHETAGDLVQALFHKQVQESYGVKLNVEDDMLWLEAPISKFRAQKRANGAAVLQFEDDMEDTLCHTGMVRNRRMDETGDANNNSTAYRLQPLSAALRINQDDVDSGTIKNGSFHAAVVFDYDKEGDAGSPLLTLSLNPSRNQVRERLKIVDRSQQLIQNPKHLLHTLVVGQGPLRGKVLRFFKGGAIIDCGVGRKVNSRGSAHQVVRVEGILRFKDAFVSDGSASNFEGRQLGDNEDDDSEDEEDGEWDDLLTIEDFDGMDEDESDQDNAYDDCSEDYDGPSAELGKVFKQLEEDEDFADSEDITHLFETRADGSIVYQDPESGDEKLIPVDDEDDEGDDDEEAAFKVIRRSTQRTKRSVQQIWPVTSSLRRSVRLYIGDEIDVYVKSISKQSSQLLLTMDSSIQGRKAKDLKDEDKVQKKLTRLAKQIGGLHNIDKLRGQEHYGVVKATSNAGDWLYVQPDVEGLPVGVASVLSDHELHEGDKVRIRIEGVDENRGQLAMLILNKI
ncbi:hypothetical protein FisN_23Lh091 [Fistulifera solaris]|uniref:S1 motif domain-containing protein n=1 Tax=Fistulifera solaris TaxID=1519565 RepID=A0A1Z5KLY4_FISSO|nr:hypothetical protein FisN_23Lh091 [Fistulifera solaris]|eukprot:GAX27334.1 hypothetical protein FisN_23Lh091 [Fistulifera solaris]